MTAWKGCPTKNSNRLERIELRGEVRAADLDDHTFSLRLDEGTKIVAPFTGDQELAITEALREHGTRRLRLSGRGEIATNRKIKRVASVESVSIEASVAGQTVSKTRPIWEVALEIKRERAGPGVGAGPQGWSKEPPSLPLRSA